MSQIVSAGDVNDFIIKCPFCSSDGDFTLFGNMLAGSVATCDNDRCNQSFVVKRTVGWDWGEGETRATISFKAYRIYDDEEMEGLGGG